MSSQREHQTTESQLSLTASAESGDLKGIVLLMVLLGASLCLNVALGWEVRQLRANVIPNRVSGRQIAVGTALPAITATDMDGRGMAIGYVGQLPTVLYIFVPSCTWCSRNLRNIQVLAEQRSNRYRFVGLSLNDVGLKEYVATHNLNFPVYCDPPADVVTSFGLGSTPQTMVISPDGKLLKNWLGAYGNALRPEIEKYFDIQLPGFSPAETSE